jgi:hypothetical protein
MKITLKQLDGGFLALQKLANLEFPKNKLNLAYRISRIYRSAAVGLEEMHAELRNRMSRFGLNPEVRIEVQDPEKVANYRHSERCFLKETQVEIGQDPIEYSEIAEFLPVPADLANLEWMIVGGPEVLDDLEKSLTA